MAQSKSMGDLVLKGGVLLAALGERRPTRDIVLQAEQLDNDADSMKDLICEIAASDCDDGLVFEVDGATAQVIRDEDEYTGVRVTLVAHLATANLHFHVDINVGDPVIPEPVDVHLPQLLGGDLVIRGYPLVMVHAEKIVTAVSRGTVNTRWRDFCDIYLLARHHAIDGSELSAAIEGVATHRQVGLVALTQALDGFGAIGQARWGAWRRRQALEERLPSQFDEVLATVIGFADPALEGRVQGLTWDPASESWS